LRLQQHLLPLSPLFTLSLKRLIEVYLVTDRMKTSAGRGHCPGISGRPSTSALGRLDFAPDTFRPLYVFGRLLSKPAATVIPSRAHHGVQGGRGGGARDLNPKSRSASDPLFACPNAAWAGRARRSMRLKRAPASLPGLQVRSIVRPRDCSPRRSDFYPKA